ncbi:MAG: alcohol dehydrogenase catalytic domain-containing protein [Clostridiaceae bacterium]|nr:alcohol dehydrogenase catalytic domain-containing protein [Clostridiaceae bacterium]
MKALYARGNFDIIVRETAMPVPVGDQVLIKVKACGLCGTDLHFAKDRQADYTPLGHEIAGEIVDLGKSAAHYRIGDKVIVEDIAFCGVCPDCKNGHPSVCRKGPTLNGQPGMSEYLAVSARLLNPFTDMDFCTASLVEPLAVSIHCTQNARIPLGGSVVVYGPGPIGLMCVSLAKRLGAARVALVGTTEKTAKGAVRLSAGRKMGADLTVAATETDPVSAILDFFPGGADSVIVTSPPATLPSALKMVRYGGAVSLAGIDLGGKDKVELSVNELIFNKMTLTTTFAEPALMFPTAIKLLSQGLIDAQSIITHTFTFAEAKDLIKRSFSGEEAMIKAVLIP